MPTQKKSYELVVQPREVTGKKVRFLRRQHILPANVYGHRIEPMAVQVDQKELERVYLRAGSNALVDLKVGGDGDTAQKVFIHDVQRNPKTHVLTHVDFIVVNLREETTATVPVVLVGEAPAVTRNEGVLLHALDHIQVRTLPANIPPQLEVDISGLDEVDKAIHVSDIALPENVTLVTNEDELIAKITALRVQVEEAEEAEEAAEAEAGETEAAEES